MRIEFRRRQFFVAYYGRRESDGATVSGMNLSRDEWDMRRPALAAEGFETVATHYDVEEDPTPENFRKLLEGSMRSLSSGS